MLWNSYLFKQQLKVYIRDKTEEFLPHCLTDVPHRCSEAAALLKAFHGAGGVPKLCVSVVAREQSREQPCPAMCCLKTVCAGLKRSSCGTANTDRNIMKSNILLCLYCVMLAAFSAELTNSTQSFLPKFPSFLSIGFMVL